MAHKWTMFEKQLGSVAVLSRLWQLLPSAQACALISQLTSMPTRREGRPCGSSTRDSAALRATEVFCATARAPPPGAQTPTTRRNLCRSARMGALFVPLSTGWLLLAVVLSVLAPQISREPHAHTRRKSRRGMLCTVGT